MTGPSTRRLLLLLTALAATTLACREEASPAADGGADAAAADDGGGPAHDAGTTDGGLAAASFCAFARAACARQTACGVPVLNNRTDTAACEAAVGCEAYEASLAAAGLPVHADAIDACVDALEARDCPTLGSQGLLGLEPCQRMTGARGPEGAPCVTGLLGECAVGLRCVQTAGCPGRCTAPAPLCDEGSCPDGQFCDALRHCQPRAAAGAPCELPSTWNKRDNGCTDGHFCRLDPMTGDARCAPQLAPGATSCQEGGSWACGMPEAFCDQGPGDASRCTPHGAIDAGCVSPEDCGADGFCSFDTGTCRPRLGLGASCPDQWYACAPGLACVGGSCAPQPDPNVPVRPAASPIVGRDATCGGGVGTCGLGLRCDFASGVCQPAGGLGSSCTSTLQCMEGTCDVNSLECAPQLADGDPCNFDGLDTRCPTGVCLRGRCASYSELATCP